MLAFRLYGLSEEITMENSGLAIAMAQRLTFEPEKDEIVLYEENDDENEDDGE